MERPENQYSNGLRNGFKKGVERRPGQGRPAVAVLPGFAAVYQPGVDLDSRKVLTPVIEAIKEVGCDRTARLDLDRVTLVRGGFDEGVDLVALFVT